MDRATCNEGRQNAEQQTTYKDASSHRLTSPVHQLFSINHTFLAKCPHAFRVSPQRPKLFPALWPGAPRKPKRFLATCVPFPAGRR